MEVKKGFQAHAKFLRISPNKLRRIADNIRKKPYTEAVAVLEKLPHKGAGLLKKVIQSAMANALFQDKNLDEEMLYIKVLEINSGPTLKRMKPRARGRADRELKRSSHISVILDEIGS